MGRKSCDEGFGCFERSLYEAMTEGIAVRVRPAFLKERSSPQEGRWLFAYTIEIENASNETVQLRSRHWRITDAAGRVEEVHGPGVVGEEPILDPGDSFTYTSGCPLTTPSGIMCGSYEMERPDGSRFQVAIPAFSLDAPTSAPMRLN